MIGSAGVCWLARVRALNNLNVNIKDSWCICVPVIPSDAICRLLHFFFGTLGLLSLIETKLLKKKTLLLIIGIGIASYQVASY